MKKRFFLLCLFLLIAKASFAQINGTTGPLTWSITDDVLTISGEGEMPDYPYNFHFNAPWNPYSESILGLVIDEGVTHIGNEAFTYCSYLTAINLPNSLKSIGRGSFFMCSYLASIIIPEGVTSIEANAFTSCSFLTTVTLPNSLTSIGNGSFFMCSSLTSIIIPEGVTSIEANAFAYCSSLTSIDIPEGVTSIGNGAFGSCPSLTSIIIPEGVTRIESGAFAHCSSLTSIDIPEGVTSIGDRVFSNCSSLTSIIIPEGVTSIGGSAFAYCSSLTSIDIPEGVTSIGNWAFSDCFNLTSITAHWQTPLSIHANSFGGVDISKIKLIVPKGTADLYKAAYVWKNFDIEESNVTGIENPAIGDQICVFPNPASENFRIGGIDRETQVTVRDLSGKVILSRTVAPNEAVSVRSLSPGIYLVAVNGKIMKLIIKK